MKMGTLNNPAFWSATAKLLKQEVPVQQGLAFTRCLKKLKAEVDNCDTLRKEILEKNCIKKNDGSLESDEKGQVVFTSKEAEVAAYTALDELFGLDSEVFIPKLSADVVAKLVLTPVEAELLEEFFNLPEEK